MSHSDFPEELEQAVQRWRFAFRRGDQVEMAAQQAMIAELVGDDPDIESRANEAMWTHDAEPLLTPAPLASLRQCLAQGWTLRVARVATGVEGSSIVTEYLAVLTSPDGVEFDGQAPERDEAFRQALDAAGIAY